MIPYRSLFSASTATLEPWWFRWRPTVRYLMETEAHVYALAISASVLLAFFPFLMVMLAIFRDVLHWPRAINFISIAIRDVFPGNSGGFLAQNLAAWSWKVPRLPVTSVLLLLITSNGIFEPLEVALNRAWGVARNRPYWKNQLISLGMVFACGTLVLLSLLFTAYGHGWVAGWAGKGQLAAWLTVLLFKAAAVPVSIFVLFLVYWLLPNRKVDPMDVMPAAIWVGLGLEALKYVNLLVRPFLVEKLANEYYVFQYSATIVLGSFVASLVVLAGGEFAARGARDPQAAQECA